MNATPSAAPSGALPQDPLEEADDADPFDACAYDADLFAEPPDEEAIPPAGRPAALEVGEAQLVEWIERIVDRDERALTALYDATLPRVFGLVRRFVRVQALAEEAVEDTYYQVWRQAVRFDPARGRALTWLLGMARSRAIDVLRREARFQHDSLDESTATEIAAEQPGADMLLDATRSHAALQRALLHLNEQPRQLLALAFFRGLSHEEIASQTALPLGTVKSQIRRALISLKQLLGDSGPHALAS